MIATEQQYVLFSTPVPTLAEAKPASSPTAPLSSIASKNLLKKSVCLDSSKKEGGEKNPLFDAALFSNDSYHRKQIQRDSLFACNEYGKQAQDQILSSSLKVNQSGLSFVNSTSEGFEIPRFCGVIHETFYGNGTPIAPSQDAPGSGFCGPSS